jgi:hypothetical protein
MATYTQNRRDETFNEGDANRGTRGTATAGTTRPRATDRDTLTDTDAMSPAIDSAKQIPPPQRG